MVSLAILRPLKMVKTHKITIIGLREVSRLCVRSTIDRKDDNVFGESQKSSTNRRIHCANVYHKTFPYFRSWFVKKIWPIREKSAEKNGCERDACKQLYYADRLWTVYLLSEMLNNIFLRIFQRLRKLWKALYFFYSRVLVLLRMYEQTFISFEYGNFHNFKQSHWKLSGKVVKRYKVNKSGSNFTMGMCKQTYVLIYILAYIWT